MEKDDEVKGNGNSYDFGARMLDVRVGRWFARDPLAGKYPSVSPYVSVVNNPILLIDPDGKVVIVSDANSQAHVLNYLEDQFGANHGYSFNENNELVYTKNDSHKDYNKHQKKINKGIMKVIKHDRIVDVEISDSKEKFEIPIKRGSELQYNEDGTIKMKNGVPELTGELRIVADQTIDINDTGGAVLYNNEADESNTAYLKMNNKMAEEGEQMSDEEGGMTGKSASSVFIHELLDHGLDYIKNGSTEKTEGDSVDNVEYHNEALQNKGKEKRIKHHD